MLHLWPHCRMCYKLLKLPLWKRKFGKGEGEGEGVGVGVWRRGGRDGGRGRERGGWESRGEGNEDLWDFMSFLACLFCSSNDLLLSVGLLLPWDAFCLSPLNKPFAKNLHPPQPTSWSHSQPLGLANYCPDTVKGWLRGYAILQEVNNCRGEY